jgi:arginyl-tRNA synthetase
MNSIQDQLHLAFSAAIKTAFGFEADPLVGVAQNDKFGDYQSNAAMGLARQITEKSGQKTNPRAVAEQIKAGLQLGPMASEVTIAGPGFLNVRLDPAWLAGRLNEALQDKRLGIAKNPSPQTVVVDYSGPNVAKQMHVGHIRSTIIGDAISRVLEFEGNKVIRQNHIGDWGTQFGRVVLAMWYEAVFHATQPETLTGLIERQQSAARAFAQDQNKPKFESAIGEIVREIAPLHQRLIDEDADGTKYFIPYLTTGTLALDELERAYVFVSAVTENPEAARTTINHPRHGPRTLGEIPRLTTTFIQNPDDPANRQELLAWQKSRTITLEACAEIYRRLDVKLKPEDERGESFYNALLPAVVKDLLAAHIARESDGAIAIFDEDPEQTPLIIQKTGGGFLYGTTDLAALRYRVQTLHANRVIYTHDSRQARHFSQVFSAARRAGWVDGVQLDYAPFGTMLGADGRPFRTRSGDTVKLKDLLDEAEERALAVVTEKNPELPDAQRHAIAHSVGIGGIKYSDLSKDRISDYVFSWETMLDPHGNSAPYLQYANARVQSIFRKGETTSEAAMQGTIALESPYELALAKHILRLGDVIETVSRELKPHHLCAYLYELASRFSGFFDQCPVLKSEEPMRSSRLALCAATAKALEIGLELLGIEHPAQM